MKKEDSGGNDMDAISELAGLGALAVGALSVFVEIAPIKLSPVSALLGWIGKRINKGISEQVAAQERKLDELYDTIDKNEIDRIRWEILNFANSCRNGVKHTQDQFEHIIALHGKYVSTIKARRLTNGLIDVQYDYIKALYRQCLEKNSFI